MFSQYVVLIKKQNIHYLGFEQQPIIEQVIF
jgi:hypothetical protein